MSAEELLVVEPAGAVAILTEGDREEGWSRHQLATSGAWPAWNPVHDVVAISSVETVGKARSTLTIASLRGDGRRTVYRTPDKVSAVIAARLPHYAQWSPSGETLSYVAQGPMGPTLHLSSLAPPPAESALTSDPIINGSPIFHSWCPDDNFLGVHCGRELSVIERKGSRTTARVTDDGRGFRTPSFSDDAEHMYFAVPSTGGVSLMRALFQGTQATAIAGFPAGVVVMPRPASSDVSAAAAGVPDTGTFAHLSVLTKAGEVSNRIEGPFIAAFWSPLGDRLALVVPLFTGDGRYVVQVKDLENRLVCSTEPFFPSVDFQLMLGFFDQYALSHSIWSRDGASLVVSGTPAADSVPPSFGDAALSWALRFQVDLPAPLEKVAKADIAFFRPRQIRLH